MSDSLELTPETATKKLSELTQRKKRIEASIENTGVNPDYMAGSTMPVMQEYNRFRSQLNSVNDDISRIVDWFNLYLLEQLEMSTETLTTSSKRLEQLTSILILITIIAVAETIIAAPITYDLIGAVRAILLALSALVLIYIMFHIRKPMASALSQTSKSTIKPPHEKSS